LQVRARQGEEGDENLCTKQERSGACAAVHEDKIFLIGGTDGSVVEYFDGTTWEELEVRYDDSNGSIFGMLHVLFPDLPCSSCSTSICSIPDDDSIIFPSPIACGRSSFLQ